MIDLDKLIDLAGKFAHHALIERHAENLTPAFTFVDPFDHVTVVGASWANREEKHVVASVVRQLLKQHNANKYSFLSEAWLAHLPSKNKLSPEDMENITPPSERDDREECIVAFATDGVDSKVRLWSIKRDKKGRVVALPLRDDLDGVDAIMGYLSNLLGGNA